jgi:hypothetical protein
VSAISGRQRGACHEGLVAIGLAWIESDDAYADADPYSSDIKANVDPAVGTVQPAALGNCCSELPCCYRSHCK